MRKKSLSPSPISKRRKRRGQGKIGGGGGGRGRINLDFLSRISEPGPGKKVGKERRALNGHSTDSQPLDLPGLQRKGGNRWFGQGRGTAVELGEEITINRR